MEAVTCCSSLRYPAVKLLILLAILLVSGSVSSFRQGRQRYETLYRTITVAVTEVAFETKPTLCVSLINATRPCIGRRAVWPSIPNDLMETINPSRILKSVKFGIEFCWLVCVDHLCFMWRVEKTASPSFARLNDRDLELSSSQLVSSLSTEETSRKRQRQSPNFIFRITNGFSQAIGWVFIFQRFYSIKVKHWKWIIQARTIVSSVTETKTMTTTYTESIGYNHFYISNCIPPVLHFPICKNYTDDTEY